LSITVVVVEGQTPLPASGFGAANIGVVCREAVRAHDAVGDPMPLHVRSALHPVHVGVHC